MSSLSSAVTPLKHWNGEWLEGEEEEGAREMSYERQFYATSFVRLCGAGSGGLGRRGGGGRFCLGMTAVRFGSARAFRCSALEPLFSLLN